eukprot:SAG22_NODE_14272_length_379_cov_1.139286_1_plen_37_part_01
MSFPPPSQPYVSPLRRQTSASSFNQNNYQPAASRSPA